MTQPFDDGIVRAETVGRFDRYIGIDYSGAETLTSSLKGLQVFVAKSDGAAAPGPPPPSPRKYWTRREIGRVNISR